VAGRVYLSLPVTTPPHLLAALHRSAHQYLFAAAAGTKGQINNALPRHGRRGESLVPPHTRGSVSLSLPRHKMAFNSRILDKYVVDDVASSIYLSLPVPTPAHLLAALHRSAHQYLPAAPAGTPRPQAG